MGFLASLPNVQFKRQAINFFGRDCFLQAWSLADRIALDKYGKQPDISDLERVCMLLCMSLVDGDGKKLCPVDELQDLWQLPYEELQGFIPMILELNKLPSTDDIEKN